MPPALDHSGARTESARAESTRRPPLASNIDRRHLLSAAGAALGLAGAGLAGCRLGPGRSEALGGVWLDTARLASGFAALARRAAPGALNLGVATLGPDRSWFSAPAVLSPMQSVFKAPLAAMALSRIDAGALSFNERVAITAADLSPPSSRINAAFAGAPLALPVADLIALALQDGDNTAADVLLGRLGGPAALTSWLTAHGVNDMRMALYERELQTRIVGLGPFQPQWKGEAAWSQARSSVDPQAREKAVADYLADPPDACTAPAAVAFLTRLARGEMLSTASTHLLLRLMTETDLAPGRLRAALPAGASLAHRPGGSGTDLGLTPATNDVGLITLADGRRLIVAAFLSGSTATEAQRDALIADAGRLAISALT